MSRGAARPLAGLDPAAVPEVLVEPGPGPSADGGERSAAITVAVGGPLLVLGVALGGWLLARRRRQPGTARVSEPARRP